jgi:hypothetical protein
VAQTSPSLRVMLASYIEQQASWRSEKAQEYPEDVRNRRCAEGLKELARFVSSLSENDERLLRIEQEHDDAATGLFQPGEVTARTISRFRFNIPNESFDALLRRLPDDLAQDRYEREQEATQMIVTEKGRQTMSDKEKRSVVERLRGTISSDEAHYESGKELGTAWAKTTATRAELEDMAEVVSNSTQWQAILLDESHSLLPELEDAFGPITTWPNDRGAITLSSGDPFTDGVVDGAMAVWDEVSAEL